MFSSNIFRNAMQSSSYPSTKSKIPNLSWPGCNYLEIKEVKEKVKVGWSTPPAPLEADLVNLLQKYLF